LRAGTGNILPILWRAGGYPYPFLEELQNKELIPARVKKVGEE
jgi:hypothetical protein